MKIKTFKRILMIILAVNITVMSVIGQYKTVKSAEVTAGIITAIGGGPILTALLIGGTVIAGGIAISNIVNSSPSDRENFVQGVKNGFHSFVVEYEKNQIIQDNAQINEQQAIQMATERATQTVNEFTEKALNVSNTTKSGLSEQTVDRWQKYCSEINKVIDQGLDQGGGGITITPTTVLNPKVVNFSSYNAPINGMETVGANTVNLDGDYYYIIGETVYDESLNRGQFNQDNVPSDRYRFYFVTTYDIGGGLQCNTYGLDVNKLTKTILACTIKQSMYLWQNNTYTIEELLNRLISNTSLPVFIFDGRTEANTFVQALQEDYKNVQDYLSVGNGAPVKPYQQDIIDSLTDTQMGESIRTGRRQKVNEGDHIITVFEEDSVPVKKTGLRTDAETGVATGEVGWDIPADDVWDKGIADDTDFPDVIGGTGTVTVPKDVVTEGTKAGEVDFPDDTDVGDTDPDGGSEDKTIKDIFEEQGGNYYPTAFDLTNIFPFCIPFDIYYCIQKFNVGTGEAPVIHIPIVYPELLQPVLGESYDVIIDFNEYIALRNIIRAFILLFFIIGLMNITRNLIRG